MNSLNGKIALITGAARGQGRAHALALAAEGADVAIIDLCAPVGTVPYELATPAELKETADAVAALDRRVYAKQVDARDFVELQTAVSEAIAELGRIDIAVINHGIWSRGALWELSEQQWQDMIDINLTSVWKSLKAVAPHMIDNRNGAIVMTSSVAGLIGVPNSAHYAAAKHGVLGLMKTAALELGPFGIRVNAVCPGLVDTAMTDWQGCYDMAAGHPDATRAEFEDAARGVNLTGGLLRAEEISAAVLWMVSDAASQLTGIALPIDGGNTILPGYNHGPHLVPTKRRE
jgi:SDR family mycofactocin-dependent oxidoreductase